MRAVTELTTACRTGRHEICGGYLCPCACHESKLDDRLMAPAAGVLSRVLRLDPADQLDVMAYVAAAWCYKRDHAPAGH